MSAAVFVTKNDGEQEEFDQEKLKKSLTRSGATVFVANDIAEEVTKALPENVTSGEIYKHAFNLLNKKSEKSAVRYSLRRSLLSLGPTGFPFEEFIAGIYRAKGYQTETGITVMGKCVEHEIDIVAYNDTELIFTEAKFHNQLGIKSDTKVALYIKARLDDLYGQEYEFGGKKRTLSRGVLITNTKFTETAKKYGKCVDTYDMISWDHPKKGNLFEMVSETGLHPMTCVNELSQHHKQELLKRGIVDCKDLLNNVDMMKEVGVPTEKIDGIVKNIDQICSR